MPHNHKARTAATTRIAPALSRRAPSCVDRLSFPPPQCFNGGSTSRLLCAEPVAPTQIDENEHDGPHVSSESQAVITTDTCPIDSRALGVGWVAWFGFPCYGPALRVGRTKKKSRGRARAIATTGVLCSPALGESDTYPAVSGGAGGAENRNAPNGTAALSFVANSEAARYVFVVVAAADVMDRGRRYDTFVLAWMAPSTRPNGRPSKVARAEGASRVRTVHFRAAPLAPHAVLT